MDDYCFQLRGEQRNIDAVPLNFDLICNTLIAIEYMRELAEAG